MFYCIFKMAHLTPALLTPALINATPKNNAELGPALKGPIRYIIAWFGMLFKKNSLSNYSKRKIGPSPKDEGLFSFE